jgi:hypothetical protein
MTLLEKQSNQIAFPTKEKFFDLRMIIMDSVNLHLTQSGPRSLGSGIK